MRYGQAAGVAALVFFMGMSGCARITTQVVEKPRVDQELLGNRGVLKGSAPADSSPRRTTRQMLQTDIELPTAEELNPWRKQPKAAAAPAAAPTPTATPSGNWEPAEEYPDHEIERPGEPEEKEPAVSGESYTVQTGDTLQKISQKFYGTTRKWKRIYNANRGVLRNSDRVYPGQKLVIPSEAGASSAGSEGGPDFK